MNCKEYEKLIPDYIEHRMNFRQLKEFGEHTGSCQNCREELEIQFLVSTGMARLEDGDSFDLQKELNDKMAQVERELNAHERILRAGSVMEVLVALVFIGAVLWIIL